MKKSKSILFLILAVALVAMFAVGCGSTNSLDAIKKDGKLIMLTNAEFPPYEYLGEENKPVGVDVDMAQAIADEIGVELEVVNMSFDGLIPALTSGKGHLVAAGLTIDPERAKSVDFSEPYANATQLIIVNKLDPKVANADDLVGKTVGVQLGTTGDYFVSDIEGVTTKGYKSALEAALDLKNGKLDAVVIDELPAKSIVATNEDLAVIEEPFTEEQYAMAVKKGDTQLLEVINKVLTKLNGDGTVTKLTEEHAQAFSGK